MPMSICLEKIVAIDLKWSSLAKLWDKSQLLEWLKILNMSHSHYLIETPNFSRLPYLEKLILKDCSRLSVIHPSIGDLKYIILLNLKDCKSLNHLPRSVYKLKSLKTLNLFGCSKIGKLEEDIQQMESLTTLVANQTAITQVPFALVRLKSIKHVSICGYEGSSCDVFPSLVLSWMTPRNHSRSLFRTFGIMPFLIKGLSHTWLAKSQKILESRPSTSQALPKKAPALIGFHDEQVTAKRSERFMSSLTIQVGGFNEAINTILKSISQDIVSKGFPWTKNK
ncbi:disease resistance protein RUN1-like isoform X2 [Prosopis cineraria]|uniref:disease resistance protein RUN1-like isoform X2 n=1 Tax=Prosopis cineraria TaxID=364024 RepID=UPI0024103896|nr:disease resistance protein RUN1-like isoform X2 [Prosopis cineraria]